MDRYEQFIAYVVDHCCNGDTLTEHGDMLLKRAEYVVANGGRRHPHPGVCDECADYGQTGECEFCEFAGHVWRIAQIST